MDIFRARGEVTNVLITGQQGIGKSALVEQYAASRHLGMATIEVGRLSDPQQIFGYMDLKDGQTTYIKGLFTQAITTPNTVVPPSGTKPAPKMIRRSMPYSRYWTPSNAGFYIDELGDYLRVAPGVVFFATLNEGFEFIGTMPLDEALRNRFSGEAAIANRCLKVRNSSCW